MIELTSTHTFCSVSNTIKTATGSDLEVISLSGRFLQEKRNSTVLESFGGSPGGAFPAMLHFGLLLRKCRNRCRL